MQKTFFLIILSLNCYAQDSCRIVIDKYLSLKSSSFDTIPAFEIQYKSYQKSLSLEFRSLDQIKTHLLWGNSEMDLQQQLTSESFLNKIKIGSESKEMPSRTRLQGLQEIMPLLALMITNHYRIPKLQMSYSGEHKNEISLGFELEGFRWEEIFDKNSGEKLAVKFESKGMTEDLEKRRHDIVSQKGEWPQMIKKWTNTENEDILVLQEIKILGT